VVGKLVDYTQAATTQRYAPLDTDPLRKVAEVIIFIDNINFKRFFRIAPKLRYKSSILTLHAQRMTRQLGEIQAACLTPPDQKTTRRLRREMWRV